MAEEARVGTAECGAGKEASGDLDIPTLNLQEDTPPKLRHRGLSTSNLTREMTSTRLKPAWTRLTNLESKTQSRLFPRNVAAPRTRLKIFPEIQKFTAT